MQQNQEKHLVCPIGPNQVFTNAGEVEIHKLRHENPESYKNNSCEEYLTQPKCIHLTSDSDISTKKDEQSLELNMLSNKTNKQQVSPAIQSEIIQRLIIKKIVTVQWNCKLCKLLKYYNRQGAEAHVLQNHYNITENDYIKFIETIQIRESAKVKKRFKWTCLICDIVCSKEKKLARCKLNHQTLFNSANPQLKSKMLTLDLVYSKYACILCNETVGDVNDVQIHISQKHVDIFNEYFCNFEVPRPTENQTENAEIVIDDDKLVVKNLLEQVGITICSKTTRFQRCGKKQLSMQEVYSCALCPHTIIFKQTQIPKHMLLKHTLERNYEKLVASIPMEVIMDGSDTVINCPCQYTSFSREILSMSAINVLYNKMAINSTDDNIDAEIKLMRIYKSQFMHHNTYRLFIKRKAKKQVERVSKNTGFNKKPAKIKYPQYTKDKSNPEVYNKKTDNQEVIEIYNPNEISDIQPNNNEIIDDNNFIISNVMFEDVEKGENSSDVNENEIVDKFKLTEEDDITLGQNDDEELKMVISFDELNDIYNTSDDDVLVMRKFLQKSGINVERSFMQLRRVQKVPKEVYSCLLCPHLTIFSSDDLKFHMNIEHKLTEDYSKLISVIAVESIIESRSLNGDDIVLVLSCICKYASFTKGGLSMQVIDRTYKEMIGNAELEITNSETKLMKIYQHQFKGHYKQKLIVVTDNEEKKRKLDL